MNLRRILLAAALITATLPTLAQDTSTADEHKHWVEVTHKFETAPLDDDALHDARFTVAEIASSHDFHAVLCEAFYTDFNESKYVYHAQIRLLYLLGAAAYQIETGKTDSEGTNLYALHSVLKGYAAILREQPKETDKKLDELAKSDAAGKLSDLIKKKGCK
jgi:hypothetical protein